VPSAWTDFTVQQSGSFLCMICIISINQFYHWSWRNKIHVLDYQSLSIILATPFSTIIPDNRENTVFTVKRKKVKWSLYRPGVAQRVGRGIALLFHDRGTRRGWVVSNTPRPYFTRGKDTVPILQEAGWAPGTVWMGGNSRPHRDSIPDRAARSSVAIPTELTGPYLLSAGNEIGEKSKLLV
jgi:hypothetical protein